MARKPARGQWLAIALVAAYLITILGKGHGIVPTGLLLLAFAFVEPGVFAEPGMGIGVVLGWLGIGIMVAGIVLPAEPPALMDVAGVALLAGSLAACGAWSDAPEALVVTGLPFGAAALTSPGERPSSPFAARARLIRGLDGREPGDPGSRRRQMQAQGLVRQALSPQSVSGQLA